MPEFKVTGPKGGTIIRRASPKRLAKALPGLVKRFKRVTVSEAAEQATVRQKLVTWGRWGVAHEPQIHYGQVRPMPLTPRLPMTTDCSGFVTLCYKLAGASDPNGLGYNGLGYTGTLLEHGRAVPVSGAKPGDLIFYGPGTAEHVVMVVEAGADPLVVSHGFEGGPLLRRHSVDKRQPVRCRTYV